MPRMGLSRPANIKEESLRSVAQLDTPEPRTQHTLSELTAETRAHLQCLLHQALRAGVGLESLNALCI